MFTVVRTVNPPAEESTISALAGYVARARSRTNPLARFLMPLIGTFILRILGGWSKHPLMIKSPDPPPPTAAPCKKPDRCRNARDTPREASTQSDRQPWGQQGSLCSRQIRRQSCGRHELRES